MTQQLIKKKELVILGVSLLSFIIVIAITILFFSNTSEKKPKSVSRPMVAEATPTRKKETGATATRIDSTVFLLTPSAGQVLSALKEAERQQEQPHEGLVAMKIMWPGYFFSIHEQETTKAIVQLDVDESGFGIILFCTVNTSDYPQVRELKPGQKIQVAGEITAIDPTGTGSIHINVEFIRFDENPVQKRTTSAVKISR
ncbi:MAG: hypothetical protein CSA26_03545 [Desulfobacterales bacterium]|nr:MAG: hypothetical protein CSA26_03545 [Desulfobacterales bacterium]